MYWTNLDGKTIGIWGMGREGTAVKKALTCHCPTAEIIEIGEENTSDIAVCQVLIKSPGVSLYRPEIQNAIQSGIDITSGTNLYFANRPTHTFTIAITGTKGKSTTSSLMAHTLARLGKSVKLGGNIGDPLINYVDEDVDFVVAELSSYQCADLMGAPDIGVLMNLYPEHLQWHGTHARYYADKWHMIMRAKHRVLNGTDTETKHLSDGMDAVWFNNPQGIHIDKGYFYDGSKPLFPISNLNLIGLHNAENACAVLMVVKMLGLDLEQCAAAFADFQPLPHRLQTIGQRGNLTYVDDSISTTPETAIAALRALDKGQDITLIAGGFDRGQDYTELARFLGEHRGKMRLVAMPDTGTKLAELAGRQAVETAMTSDMPTAVSVANHITPKGGTVLLSPAAPSYNLYVNFEARGNDFKKWALEK